jgi:hypothetical protein
MIYELEFQGALEKSLASISDAEGL